jgi:hypothetical protein
MKESLFNDIDLMPAYATPLIVFPDMDDNDIEAEWQAMRRRSQAVNDFLTGNITASDYLDYIEHDNIDVSDYLDSWEENLDLLYDAA